MMVDVADVVWIRLMRRKGICPLLFLRRARTVISVCAAPTFDKILISRREILNRLSPISCQQRSALLYSQYFGDLRDIQRLKNYRTVRAAPTLFQTFEMRLN